MTKSDLITIGIACYNAQDTILRALESALKQNWDHKEIVIVDDASNDNSVETLEEFIKKHENVKLIRHEKNKGPAATRQTILDNASGVFVAFFDDDDESLPERLEKQHQRIANYEEETGEHLIACYASGQRLYPNGYTLDLKAIGSEPAIPHGPKVADRLLFFGGDPGFFYGAGTPTCSLMARKKTFEAIGGFDPDFRRVEDIDFAVRLALANGHFIGCPEQLFIQHATEATDKAPEKNRDAELKLAEKHKEYLQSVNRYTYAKKWPLLRYHHFNKQYAHMILILLELLLRHPLKTASHFLTTAPKRFLHERKMKRKQTSCV